jgi:hypothetical protein
MSNNINENLLDKDKGELQIELKENIVLDEKKEGNIEVVDIAKDNPNDDKATLESMGFPKDLIDKIYSVMHPENLEEALDYLNKNDKDKFTHSYIPNNTTNVCSICGYKRSDHAVDDIDDIIINPPKIEEKKEEIKNDIIDLIEDNDLLDDNDEDLEIKNMLNKYVNKFKNNNFINDNNRNSNSPRECGVCGDTLESADLNKVRLPCKHVFCVDCWKEYLKEKINNANVYKLACMDHECNFILEEKFIKSILDNDTVLLEKYDKFLNRKKLMDTNKKIKLCPFPDCDGYAEKKGLSKYVKCNKGHDFCFECLAAPHGFKACSKIIDAGFEEWKQHTMVKRCPNCKFWTEKNEGCNHMTCSQCQFQWCWICQKECVAGHYDFGPCKGLHFEKTNNEDDAKKLMRENCDCCCVVGWLITNFIYLMIYLFMMPCFYLAVLGFKYLDDYGGMCCATVFYCMSFLPFFISYEVLTVCYVVVLSIPGLFICPYNRFLKNILFGKILGQLFPV